MKETTAIRLKKIMKERRLRQVDILNLSLPYCQKFGVKMNKSDISQYVSGKVEPSQEKLVVLGMALNVSEGWLMGLDVSPLRKDAPHEAYEDSVLPSQADLWIKIREDKALLNALEKYMNLSETKKKHVIDTIDMLCEV